MEQIIKSVMKIKTNARLFYFIEDWQNSNELPKEVAKYSNLPRKCVMIAEGKCKFHGTNTRECDNNDLILFEIREFLNVIEKKGLKSLDRCALNDHAN